MYLCCGEEDLFIDVAYGAGGDPQAHAWEHVGVVPLARVELPPIGQGHRVKWTATGEDAPSLVWHTCQMGGYI